MRYQWGLKSPFTFATSSELWGIDRETGKYPVKIYTIDGVLIYQTDNGGDNKDKQPAGGIIVSSTLATSMMETIKNPITFYANNSIVINQEGQTRDMLDYYWTSYSRGSDGEAVKPNTHFYYLDEYKAQRLKSIYDPCPYGFRVPSNGTYNDLIMNGWTKFNYTGGSTWFGYWFPGTGYRLHIFTSVGYDSVYWMSIPNSLIKGYYMVFNNNRTIYLNNGYAKSTAFSVRCIDFVSPPRPTDETSLQTQQEKASILVNKIVMLVV